MLPKLYRRGFDSLVLLMGWMLWKERNARTVRGTSATAVELAAAIKMEVDSWCAAVNRHLALLRSRA